MSSTEREQRLKFLNLTKRDEELLRALRPLLERHIAVIVDGFYEHLLSFPETRNKLQEHTTVDRLKGLLRKHLMRITEGNYDAAYFEERVRVGRTHEHVGLEPRWYLLAYNHLCRLVYPLIREFYVNDHALAHDSMVAVQKIFMLDASLAMDAYIASDRYRRLQQLESIVNDSADVIFMLDNEKRFLTWNRSAERVFGWQAGEILGKHLTVIVPAELVAAGELEKINREIHRRGFHHLETVRLAKSGRRVPVEVAVSLLRDPQGHPMGRSTILRDITERKRLEEAKVQSERLATIGAMSAKLAHEIRNPLSSITLNIDLVRDEVETLAPAGGPAAAEARALLKSIDSEVRRIQRVVEDYLQFARLPRLQRDLVNLNEVLAQGLSFMQSLFDANRVTVRTEFDGSLPVIHADDQQLWQAILNLIRNALDAMSGGGTLTLQTSRDGGEVVCSISDTGTGMSEPERQQIFKPFYSTKAGGTGLGLPLAQQIIAEHSGHIECQTAEGKGTTFIIRLPAAEETMT